jgi:hypothetical protein
VRASRTDGLFECRGITQTLKNSALNRHILVEGGLQMDKVELSSYAKNTVIGLTQKALIDGFFKNTTVGNGLM